MFDNIRQKTLWFTRIGGLMLGDDSGATRTINWDIPEGKAVGATKSLI